MKRLLTITFAVITALLLVSCSKEKKEPTRFTLDDDTNKYIWVSPIPIEDEDAELPGFWESEWYENGRPDVWCEGEIGLNVEGYYCTLSFADGMATKTEYRYLKWHDGKDWDGTKIDILKPSKVEKKPYTILHPHPQFTIEDVGSGYVQWGIMVFEGVTYHKVTLKEFKEMQKKVDSDFKLKARFIILHG